MNRRRPGLTQAGKGSRIARAPGDGLVGRLLLSWALLAAVELALAASIGRTALTDSTSSLTARIGSTATALVLLLVSVFVLGTPLDWVGRLRGRMTSRAVRVPILATQLLVLFLLACLYFGSWAAYWNLGVFFDREAVAFWLPHPVQVIHWVYPPLIVSAASAAVAVTFVLGSLLPRVIARTEARTMKTATNAAVAFGAICVGAVVVAHAIEGGSPEYAQFARARDHRSSPMSRALADLMERRPIAQLAPVAEDPRVIRRPIISMEQYLTGVDRARLKPWNVVMVQVESLRSDQLRVYGGTRDVMPTVDALARTSRVFTNGYIQASHSNYADLVPLSSQYPLRAPSQYDYPANPPYPRVLIYDVLKALGYSTAIFSSQNENWGGMDNYHRASSLDRFAHAANFPGSTYTAREDLAFSRWVEGTGGAGSVDDSQTIEAAMLWVDKVVDRPFFLHMNLQSSHVPYVVPDDFRRRFGPAAIDFPIIWGSFPMEKLDIVKARYADSLFYEDTQIARLFARLRERGLWDRTIIVIGGDNGEAFYEHGFAAHASFLFNEVVKVPMIVRAPGLTPGVDARAAMFLDVPPSILALLGLPPHPGFQGISLLEADPNPDRPIYMVVQTPMAYQSGIVRGPFKLLADDRGGPTFLFNLAVDPAEQHDITADKPDAFEDLSGRLAFWRQQQLAYYSDLTRQAREYPPVIVD